MIALQDLPEVALPDAPLLAVGFPQLLVVHHRQPAFTTAEHSNPYLQVCIKLGQAHEQTETVQGRTRTTMALPGSVGLYPAGLHYTFTWDREAEFLQLFLSPALISTTSRELFGEDRSVPGNDVTSGHDPLLVQLGLALRSAAENGSGPAHVAILARALVAHLLTRPFVEEEGLKTLTRAIESQLARPWTVAEMAAFMGLSQHHFSRKFQQEVGLAPYQFLLKTRIEKAAELLEVSPRSVADIAQQVGFSHQGHLNYHFKKLLGRSPIAFRRQSRFPLKSSTI